MEKRQEAKHVHLILKIISNPQGERVWNPPENRETKSLNLLIE